MEVEATGGETGLIAAALTAPLPTIGGSARFSVRRHSGSCHNVSSDDNQLIRQCLAGRTEAFGELVIRYQDRLCNSLFRVLGSADDARIAVEVVGIGHERIISRIDAR